MQLMEKGIETVTTCKASLHFKLERRQRDYPATAGTSGFNGRATRDVSMLCEHAARHLMGLCFGESGYIVEAEL